MLSKKIAHSPFTIALFAAIAAFLTYTMIFGFRKAFTVTTFEGIGYWGFSLKTLMVVSQVLGYLLAKFYGIRYIAELGRYGRGKVIVVLTGIAWLAWLGFALVPAPYSLVFLFVNGFPLGMLWGVVFSYIEGRRSTDFIGAALSVSFIFSSGFVKSVGGWLMQQFNAPEQWVPFFAGALFAGPLLLFVWLMEQIPAPSPLDTAERMQRQPMTKAQRQSLLRQFWPGLLICITIYTFATIFRDIRDNFSADMWLELGFGSRPAIFTQTELPVTLTILVLIGSLTLVRNSFSAFMLAHLAIAIGFAATGLSSWLFMHQSISAFAWMVGTGMGLYMVYIPFNSMFFDRFIAVFNITGNVGFLIYLADSVGYVGSVGVLLTKEIFKVNAHWVSFFTQSTMWLSAVGLLFTLAGTWYFHKKKKTLERVYKTKTPS
jgi:LPXTG-motif cell wall-anchored protein